MEKISLPKPWEKGLPLWLLWLMVMITMSSIFVLSSQPAPASAKLSGELVDLLVKNLVGNFHSLSLSEQAAITTDWSFVVRKTAHATIYTLLGFVTMLAVYKTAKQKPLKITLSKGSQTQIALAIGFSFALSDEIHQRFVAGRSSELRDVLIDLGGTALGIAIAWVWLKAKKRRYINKAHKFNAQN
ncbi:MAG: VanZ family protein [Acetobacterium sp.]